MFVLDYILSPSSMSYSYHCRKVTDFLPHHPGGSKAILQLAGRDATKDYDPIHPPGTLESGLRLEAKLGRIEPSTLPRPEEPPLRDTPGILVPLDTLLNLDDIEEVAKRQISYKVWAYYYSAADDLISKRLNNEVYRSILLRPRVFIDVEKCDISTTLLGYKVGLPVYVSPAAAARLAHQTGEAGIAQACGKFDVMQLISNNASMSPEQIVEHSMPGQVFGFQFYVQVVQSKNEAMLARINKLSDKIKFICLTLDAPTPGNREHDERAANTGTILSVTSIAHSDDPPPVLLKPVGIADQLFAGTARNLTWETTLPWLRARTNLPIVLKGIQTHEDARLASLHAPVVRGIILSNHGGRELDTSPPAIHTLLEIRKYCPEVFDKLEVWVDGGVRRGTDVVKAMCLGARGVGIGRAGLWGLAAGGPEGVERTLESTYILHQEPAALSGPN
ncbi:MAG: Cytochrome b5 domain-containing protein 1 [Geoglossum umbratile]|nr:MAG: Cytochrome b5 domain-containing protein 1 [Geoglossum umbratile]